MARRLRLLLVGVMVVLTVSGAAPANRTGSARAPTTRLAGGSYQLIAAAATTAGPIGAGYRLAPAMPAAGEGCCCKSLLPCLAR